MKIYAPHEGHTGTESYGEFTVEFMDGVATVDELPDAVRCYMQGAGYGFEVESADITVTALPVADPDAVSAEVVPGADGVPVIEPAAGVVPEPTEPDVEPEPVKPPRARETAQK